MLFAIHQRAITISSYCCRIARASQKVCAQASALMAIDKLQFLIKSARTRRVAHPACHIMMVERKATLRAR